MRERGSSSSCWNNKFNIPSNCLDMEFLKEDIEGIRAPPQYTHRVEGSIYRRAMWPSSCTGQLSYSKRNDDVIEQREDEGIATFEARMAFEAGVPEAMWSHLAAQQKGTALRTAPQDCAPQSSEPASSKNEPTAIAIRAASGIGTSPSRRPANGTAAEGNSPSRQRTSGLGRNSLRIGQGNSRLHQEFACCSAQEELRRMRDELAESRARSEARFEALNEAALKQARFLNERINDLEALVVKQQASAKKVRLSDSSAPPSMLLCSRPESVETHPHACSLLTRAAAPSPCRARSMFTLPEPRSCERR